MKRKEIYTEVPALGEAKIPSPIQKRSRGANSISFVADGDRIVIDVNELQIKKQIKDDLILKDW